MKIVATNVLASRPPECRRTGTPTARAKRRPHDCSLEFWPKIPLLAPDPFSEKFWGNGGGLAALGQWNLKRTTVTSAQGQLHGDTSRQMHDSPPGLTCLVQGSRMCESPTACQHRAHNRDHYSPLQRLRHICILCKAMGEVICLSFSKLLFQFCLSFPPLNPRSRPCQLQTVSTTQVNCSEQRQPTAEASCFQLFFF